ncbi:MAG: type II toxin-antitoxin system HipA family toxin [bacterium]
MKKILNVFWERELIGKIIKERSYFSFRYAKSWLKKKDSSPISLSLPLQEEPFDSHISQAFFGNLLPESEIREKIAHYFGFSIDNDYALLDAIGMECAGALVIIPEDKTIPDEGSYIPITIEELEKMIENQKNRPLLIGREGIRLSLAGAQDKLPVYMKENKLYLPQGGVASNCIIKPEIKDFENTVHNEAFCMMLAQRSGLNVPDSILQQGDKNFLIVKRYDRKEEGNKVLRIHQEDFCQALGISYNQKYESEGGPGLSDCFNLLDNNSVQPALDKKRLLEFVVFNYYIGNADAHAKNISLLYKRDGILLSPFYDLMSTLVYDGLSKKMAMKIGGENRFDWVRKRHWERLAKSIDVKPQYVIDMLVNLGERIRKEAVGLILEYEQKGLYMPIMEKISGIISTHHYRCMAELR